MSGETLEEVVAELSDPDWLIRGLALRKLTSFGSEAVEHLPTIFALTFDEKAPVRTNASAVIKKLGNAAVPFQLVMLKSPNWEHRARSAQLLMESGFRKCSSTRLVEQVLETRSQVLPDFGQNSNEVKAELRRLLTDENIRVRFAAASTLEEFDWFTGKTVTVFTEVILEGTDHSRNWAALRLGRIGQAAMGACGALRSIDCELSRYTALAIQNAIERIGCKCVK